MISNEKARPLIIIIIGIIFAFIPIFISNSRFTAKDHDIFSNYNDEFDYCNLKISTVSGKIYIDNNWTSAKAAGICTGNGSKSDPYIIEDLVIDGGGSGNCILIENSKVFFKIENCTVYNSGSMGQDAGIKLYNANNSDLINNNCSSNYIGISLNYCYNNTISGNTATYSMESGIILYLSDNNLIVNNSLYRGRYGIHLYSCRSNTISKNKMNECGLNLYGDLSSDSIIADTSNLVNEKPIYYYNNKTNLNSNNFTNAGQVILYNCHDSSIENLNVSYGSTGISLDHCNKINITGNIANHNKIAGISISESYKNNISENTLDYNEDSGIDLYRSYANVISKNNASYNFYGVHSWICGSNNISGNAFNINRGHGVYLYDSTNYYVSGNTINTNSRYGVFIYESNDNVLSENTVNRNAIAGIYLLSSDYNNISENVLTRNGKCIKEEDCRGNIFINNKCVEFFTLKLIIVILIVGGIITIISIGTILIIRRLRKKKRIN